VSTLEANLPNGNLSLSIMKGRGVKGETESFEGQVLGGRWKVVSEGKGGGKVGSFYSFNKGAMRGGCHSTEMFSKVGWCVSAADRRGKR